VPFVPFVLFDPKPQQEKITYRHPGNDFSKANVKSVPFKVRNALTF